MANKFELGRTVVTKAVYERMQEDLPFAAFVLYSLRRYTACDWGELNDIDKASNEAALQEGNRLFGFYKQASDSTIIYIITEWDRSATTILFPSDY